MAYNPQYQFAAGYDNTGGLALLDPQPFNPQVLRYETRYAADGVARVTGRGRLQWVYNVLDDTTFDSLLTTFGLSIFGATPTLSAECTVSIRNIDGTHDNYNAVITLTDYSRQQNDLLQNIVFELTNVRPI